METLSVVYLGKKTGISYTRSTNLGMPATGLTFYVSMCLHLYELVVLIPVVL